MAVQPQVRKLVADPLGEAGSLFALAGVTMNQVDPRLIHVPFHTANVGQLSMPSWHGMLDTAFAFCSCSVNASMHIREWWRACIAMCPCVPVMMVS